MGGLLVVDDDPLIAGMLRLVLESEGYAVIHAEDGRVALGALEDGAPACMVLDLMMPNVDGYGVLESLRRDGSTATRVVMLTCCSQEEDVARCFELGADAYLTKPVDVDNLLHTVRDLLSTDIDVLRARRSAVVADPAALKARVDAALSRHAAFLAS